MRIKPRIRFTRSNYDNLSSSAPLCYQADDLVQFAELKRGDDVIESGNFSGGYRNGSSETTKEPALGENPGKTEELVEDDPYKIHKNLQLLFLPLMGPLEGENDQGFCNLHILHFPNP